MSTPLSPPPRASYIDRVLIRVLYGCISLDPEVVVWIQVGNEFSIEIIVPSSAPVAHHTKNKMRVAFGLIVLGVSAACGDICVPEDKRVECGFPGITPQQCNAKGESPDDLFCCVSGMSSWSSPHAHAEPSTHQPARIHSHAHARSCTPVRAPCQDAALMPWTVTITAARTLYRVCRGQILATTMATASRIPARPNPTAASVMLGTPVGRAPRMAPHQHPHHPHRRRQTTRIST